MLEQASGRVDAHLAASMPTGASTSGPAALLRSRSLPPGRRPAGTRARSYSALVGVRSPSIRRGRLCENTAFSPPVNRASGCQGCRLRSSRLAREQRALRFNFLVRSPTRRPWPPVASRSLLFFAPFSFHCCPTSRCSRRPRLVVTSTALLSPVVNYHGLARCHLQALGFPDAAAAERRYVGRTVAT